MKQCRKLTAKNALIGFVNHCMYLKYIVIFVSMLSPLMAVADWVSPGASYKCDSKGGEFGIRSTMDTSLGSTMPLSAGFKKLDEGRTEMTCKLAGALVKAAISVMPGKPGGNCASAALIQVSLSLNEHKVLDNELFNSGCFIYPVVYEVGIFASRNGRSEKIVLCRGSWSWEEGYANGKCSEVSGLQ